MNALRYPVRLVRLRQKDGKEVEYWEKLVVARDCDVEGCNRKASDTIASPASDNYTEIAMCSNHHDEYGYPRHINTESYDVTKNLYWFWNEQQKNMVPYLHKSRPYNKHIRLVYQPPT